jgi:hypothetical protein
LGRSPGAHLLVSPFEWVVTARSPGRRIISRFWSLQCIRLVLSVPPSDLAWSTNCVFSVYSLLQIYREHSSLLYHMRFHHTTKPRSTHFHTLTHFNSQFSFSILKSQTSDEYTPFGSGNMLRMQATAHFGNLMWPWRPIERMDARKRYEE